MQWFDDLREWWAQRHTASERILYTLLELEEAGVPQASELSIGANGGLKFPWLGISLEELEEKGSLSRRAVGRADPPEYYYRLTSEGRKEAEAYRQEIQILSDAVARDLQEQLNGEAAPELGGKSSVPLVDPAAG